MWVMYTYTSSESSGAQAGLLEEAQAAQRRAEAAAADAAAAAAADQARLRAANDALGEERRERGAARAAAAAAASEAAEHRSAAQARLFTDIAARAKLTLPSTSAPGAAALAPAGSMPCMLAARLGQEFFKSAS